jgi:hypothetical protein
VLWTSISNYLEILIHGSRSLTYYLPYKIYCREPEVRSHIPGEFSHVSDLINRVIIRKTLTSSSCCRPKFDTSSFSKTLEADDVNMTDLFRRIGGYSHTTCRIWSSKMEVRIPITSCSSWPKNEVSFASLCTELAILTASFPSEIWNIKWILIFKILTDGRNFVRSRVILRG